MSGTVTKLNANQKKSIAMRGKHRSRKTEFKKGHRPWCAGKTHETDSRIAQPWLGKKIPQEVLARLSVARKGKNTGAANLRWKGGITKPDDSARLKFRREMQKQVFERDDYTCQMCGDRAVELQVDHIQPWAEYVELRFSMDNCRTLCKPCHYEITYGHPMKNPDALWGRNLTHAKRRAA